MVVVVTKRKQHRQVWQLESTWRLERRVGPRPSLCPSVAAINPSQGQSVTAERFTQVIAVGLSHDDAIRGPSRGESCERV